MRWVLTVLVAALMFAPLAQAQDASLSEMEERAFDLMINGDPSDDAEARRLMRELADAGQPEAVNALAAMLLNGLGGPADLEEGQALFNRAVEMGSIGANMSASDYYISGQYGYPRDPERGFRHAVIAAEATHNRKGAAHAQWQVGMLVLRGVGTLADPARAYEWVSRAADNGAVQGMISRAVMLATGEGVAIDALAAREWYRRAAESGEIGSAHGLRGLGAMLAMGEGGPVDLSRGYAYLRLAQEAGDPNAGRIIELLTPQITDRHRAEAAVIIGAFRIQHPPLQPDSVTRSLGQR